MVNISDTKSKLTHDQLKLWFFHDITEEQRLSLISLILNKTVAQECTNHHHQSLALKMMVERLIAEDLKERLPHDTVT